MAITPFFIVFLILLDVIMVINKTFLDPIAKLLKCCGVDCLHTGIEKFYNSVFQMSSSELAGVQHMRTITQLSFETVIQFGVQISMIIHMKFIQDDMEAEVDMNALYVSMASALLHMFLEFLQLWSEALAS